MALRLILLLIFLPSISQASFQSGIGVEMVFASPQMTASLGGTEAKYNGVSLGTNLILPLLDYNNNFSIDLTVGYRYANYENTASTGTIAEWARLQGFNTGTRFNLKYFFLGLDIIFVDGKHIVAGSRSELFDYNINPIQGYAGFNIPLSDMVSLAASYKQHLAKGQATINGLDLSVNEQFFMLTLQFDLGIGFFNVIEDDATFKFLDGTEI